MLDKRPPMPPLPWKKGSHGTHDVAVLTVQVCRDEFGRVYSIHSPETEDDQNLMASWPSHGMEQASLALLTEALRREALFQTLLQMSKDKNYVAKVNALSPGERETVMTKMVEKLRKQTHATVEHLLLTVVEDAFNLINRG